MSVTLRNCSVNALTAGQIRAVIEEFMLRIINVVHFLCKDIRPITMPSILVK